MTDILDYIQVFKGGTISNDEVYIKNHKINKVIVFDIDETIGSFYELMLLWNCFEQFNVSLNQEIFNDLLDLFPEFLRYGIITIFEYLLHKKCIHDCYKIYIYTNNIYSPEFPLRIKNYFDYKLNTVDFFDKIICAFKVNDQIIEQSRTTNKKTYNDFIRCSILPQNTEICFIDDTYYDKMKHDKVYYIQSKPYEHGLSYNIITDRFFNSNIFTKNVLFLLQNQENRNNIIKYMQNYFIFFGKKKCIKDNIETNIDILVTQKMMSYIKDFFEMKKNNNNKTTKNKKHYKKLNNNSTRKKSVKNYI